MQPQLRSAFDPPVRLGFAFQNIKKRSLLIQALSIITQLITIVKPIFNNMLLSFLLFVMNKSASPVYTFCIQLVYIGKVRIGKYR